MNNKINKTVEKFNMLNYGDSVLVGCSGGADSMLLLNYFLSVKQKMGLKLIVAHVEHGIRGKESLDDAEFVKAFCLDSGIEFHLLSIDAVKESKKLGIGVEEYSRKRRYEFFNSIKCDKIATAHNLSDNAETVLFRLARGTGLKGICGIPAVRGKIIRPLIELSASEVRKYCDDNGIMYRVDSTNLCNDYSRNFIRNKIIPLMLKVNDNFYGNIKTFTENISQDNDFINKYTDDIYPSVVTDEGLKIGALNECHLSVKKRVLMRYFSENGLTLDFFHINSVLRLFSVNSKTQIKGNYFAVSDGKYLRIADFSLNKSEIKFPFITQVLKNSEFDNKNVDFFCDCDKIVGSVSVRSRENGDKIKPYKRNCTKTLKKLFNELKIPEESRSGIGIVTDDNGVIGVIGYCVDERVVVTPETKNILSLKLLMEDNNGKSF